VAITYDYKFNVYSRKMPEDPEQVKTIWENVLKRLLKLKDLDFFGYNVNLIILQAHKRSAERLLDLCTTNGGVFVKVGQHLGALDYLLPPPFIETLRILHSQAPYSSLEDVYKVIRQDLKIKVCFSFFLKIMLYSP
jgi:predicted unusual protein kinase regulating ubiquinone biosynthesis (AarF/ABC1/UbiB family)